LFFHETINLDTGKSLKDYVKIHSKYSAGIFLKKYLANKIWFIQNKLAYTPLFSHFRWVFAAFIAANEASHYKYTSSLSNIFCTWNLSLPAGFRNHPTQCLVKYHFPINFSQLIKIWFDSTI